ncbi:MAG: hypothetical protein WCC27_03665 [Acidobacteriaceae bacterium]
MKKAVRCARPGNRAERLFAIEFFAARATFILVITIMDTVEPPVDPTPSQPARWFDLRLAVAVILLLPAFWFSWKTVDGLAARRLMRTDLADVRIDSF